MSQKFPQRKIGDDYVSAIGLGCLGMSISLSSRPRDDQESHDVLTEAANIGINFWDTSDAYGDNQKIIGKWIKESGRRNEIFLATKFGVKRYPDGRSEVHGEPEYVKNACEASLKDLETEYIDLYFQHRMDPKTPIEKTVKAMVELKNEGKIRYLGLSECSAHTLRRAHKVHPIAAVQMEYSPFALEIESPDTNLLNTARELGVKIVSYSPLGRGFLTGAIRRVDDLDPEDYRRTQPRFSEENFTDNFRIVEAIEAIAKEKGCTVGQLALAWVLTQGEGEGSFFTSHAVAY